MRRLFRLPGLIVEDLPSFMVGSPEAGIRTVAKSDSTSASSTMPAKPKGKVNFLKLANRVGKMEKPFWSCILYKNLVFERFFI
jgi:hypothetical protein